MLKSLFDQIAVLLDPDPDLHAGDDSHAVDEDDDMDQAW
jgi:hypothetical protein